MTAKAARCPRCAKARLLRLESIRPDQHFTEPPPRYNDATLVKDLEEKGIGRPSTYAAIISTIVEREYVTKDQGRFSPTMLGERVSVLLVKSFEDIFDVGFTARMEEELDEIEEGKLGWKQRGAGILRTASSSTWIQADDEMDSYKAGIPTGQKCEKCGEGELLERISRHGFFLGCYRYPDCDYITRSVARASRRSGWHAQNRVLRQLRQGNGHQARALWRVPRLQRLSGLQDDPATGGRHAHRAPARRPAR